MTSALKGSLLTLSYLEFPYKVALYGIYFDSGKADMKPESSAAIEEIGKLLAGNSSLKLLVVGHTVTWAR